MTIPPSIITDTMITRLRIGCLEERLNFVDPLAVLAEGGAGRNVCIRIGVSCELRVSEGSDDDG